MRKRAQIAGLAGLFVSAALFLLFYATNGLAFASVLYFAQAPGLWTTMVFIGLHSAVERDYALVAIPVNAAIYGLVIFVAMSVWTKARKFRK